MILNSILGNVPGGRSFRPAGWVKKQLEIQAAGLAGNLDKVWRDEVEHVSHRIYSTGFYYGFPGQYTENSRYIREWQICAIVESCDENGLATCSLRNKFKRGDQLELVGPDTRPFAFHAGDMWDEEGSKLTEPRKPEMKFTMQLEKPVPAKSIIRRSVDLSAK